MIWFIFCDVLGFVVELGRFSCFVDEDFFRDDFVDIWESVRFKLFLWFLVDIL